MPMFGIAIFTDGGWRRRWSGADTMRMVEEMQYGGESISAVARRNGVAPNRLYRWHKLMLEGGSIALAGDDGVTSNKICEIGSVASTNWSTTFARRPLKLKF